MSSPSQVSWKAIAVVVIVCVLLYVPGVFGGRPLSIHEARLPELAREMVTGASNWVLPQSGGRPWLERPPLPHWCTAVSMLIFRRTSAVWVARLPAALAAAYICLAATWIATRWFGLSVGLLSGIVLASSYEIYQYATLAEDDIYLGALVITCVALFVRIEWPSDQFQDRNLQRRASLQVPFGRRPVTTLMFFVMLGLTNLAKGPMVGALPVVVAIAVFLLARRDRSRILHWRWIWGWLLFIAIALAWPCWALHRFPDVWNNWRFDYLGHADGVPPDAAKEWNEPVWYYAMMLPLALLPWTWATVIGFARTARAAWKRPDSAERFCWVWAVVGVLVLSLPARKHHHYLVPLVAPFAILSAVGLMNAGGAILRSPEHLLARQRVAATFVLILIAMIALSACMQICVISRDEATIALLRLCEDSKRLVPPGQPIFVNADTGSLEFFRIQFTIGTRERLLHNLSFLRDVDLEDRSEVYLITRAKDTRALQALGSVEAIEQQVRARRETSPSERFTLFRLALSPTLVRGPRPSTVGVLEAMGRKPGPFIVDNPWSGSESRRP